MGDLSKARGEYLYLLRKCLTRGIFEDGSFAVCPPEGGAVISKAQHDPFKRERGRDWPQHAETMIGERRLADLQDNLLTVMKHEIPGDYVECGIWRGGTVILAAKLFELYNQEERIAWGFDSFEGLPKGGRYTQDLKDKHHTWNDVFSVGIEEVKNNFERYHVQPWHWALVKGWFADTCPTWAKVQGDERQISVLRIDGDMYEGTYDSLSNLYDKVAPGGFIIVDDYGDVTACREAVQDYLLSIKAKRSVTLAMHEIDHTAVRWRKPQ